MLSSNCSFHLFVSFLTPKLLLNPQKMVLTKVWLYSSSLTSNYLFLQPSLEHILELPTGAAPVGHPGKLMLRLKIAHMKQSVCILQTQISCQTSCDNYKALGGLCLGSAQALTLVSHCSPSEQHSSVSHTTQPQAPAVPPGSQPQTQENSCENRILLTVGTQSLNSQEENKRHPSPLIASVAKAQGRKGERSRAAICLLTDMDTFSLLPEPVSAF